MTKLTHMNYSPFLFAIAFASLLINADKVAAQLFGAQRQLGQPIQRRPQAGVAAQLTEEAGQVLGNERFLRTNRRRGDFVGSDRFDRRGFVGSQKGTTTGSALQSTTGVRPDFDRSRQINQPLPPPKAGQPNYPPISLGFSNTIPATGILHPELLRDELTNPDYFSPGNRFEVSVEDRTAILRGVVADARQKDLAELLVSFEPGISAVKNELRVGRPAVLPVDSRSLRRSEPSDLPPPPPTPGAPTLTP